MVVVGYGDIGAACAKIAKNGFGMKVWGIKRNPAECSDLYRSYCDEVLGNDDLFECPNWSYPNYYSKSQIIDTRQTLFY